MGSETPYPRYSSPSPKTTGVQLPSPGSGLHFPHPLCWHGAGVVQTQVWIKNPHVICIGNLAVWIHLGTRNLDITKQQAEAGLLTSDMASPLPSGTIRSKKDGFFPKKTPPLQSQTLLSLLGPFISSSIHPTILGPIYSWHQIPKRHLGGLQKWLCKYNTKPI